jgi:sensor domain CHASE-containing protein
MDTDPTAQFQWRYKSVAVFERVPGAKSQLSPSLKMKVATMLAAADELGAAPGMRRHGWRRTSARILVLGTRVAWMLKTCAEVAPDAQLAIAEPFADTEAVIGRLGILRAIIDLYSQTMNAS